MRRRVYFLSGFDPRGAAFYYRHFADQLQVFRRNSQRPLRISRMRERKDSLLSRWRVLEGSGGEANVVLDYCFMHWDDIARNNWPRQPQVLIWDALFVYSWYLLGGGIQRIARMSPSVALCGLYPALFFVLASVVAALGAIVSYGWLIALGLAAPWPQLLAVLVLGALGALAWQWADRLGVVWLFRSIRFTHALGQERDRELRPRLGDLAERILALEQEDPAAEIVLVGHSSGSFVMAMLAAALRRQQDFAALAPRMRLLSLGQNLANLAVHEGAHLFHADLLELAQEPRLPWRDITSRDDYLCFAGVDPYRSCGLAAPLPIYPELELIGLAERRGLSWPGAIITQQFTLHLDYISTAPQGSEGFDYIAELLESEPA